MRLELEKEGLGREEVERRLRRARRRASPWIGVLLLAGLVFLVVVLVMLLSGGESDPEKAVKTFYRAIKEKDVITYLKHTEPEVYKMAKSGEYQPDPFTEGIDYDSYTLEGLRTRLVKEEGDYAEVEVTGGFFEGFYDNGARSGGIDFASHPRLIKLVKIEGTWVVQEYATAKLPYPVEEIGGEQPEFPEVEEGGGG